MHPLVIYQKTKKKTPLPLHNSSVVNRKEDSYHSTQVVKIVVLFTFNILLASSEYTTILFFTSVSILHNITSVGIRSLVTIPVPE